jgi:UDP-N-acetyl-D-glucosamine dehydrogenase
MRPLAIEMIDRMKSHRAQIGVLGLGYAGLPLALCFAEAGFTTLGFDVDHDKLQKLSNGQSYIGHIESSRIAKLVKSTRLLPTPDMDELRQCDAAIICVPTPLGEGRVPDLSYVVNTAREISRRLHPGQLIALESTTYPGTTEEVLRAIFDERGMEPGRDYFLVFSPEREDPGNHHYTTRSIPKVVGGVTPDCLAVGAAAYSEIVDRVISVSSARVAEAVKLLENIYRCVNIALVNELKLLLERMAIDIWEVIDAASTKPFGFSSFYPGPGLGGHCIPIDPFYLSWKAREYGFAARFIELAGEINSAMPEHVVNRIAEGLNLMGKPLNGAEILLIGVAYKRDVDDVRESPALSIIKTLEFKLARVRYHDPYVSTLRSRHLVRAMRSVALTAEIIADTDVVVIVTDHSGIDYSMIMKHAKLVVDTRNATRPWRRESKRILLA